MKTYDVVLSKSYIIRIKAENKIKAKRFSEIFTGDTKDISTIEDKKNNKFEIETIDCTMNETYETVEVYEKN